MAAINYFGIDRTGYGTPPYKGHPEVSDYLNLKYPSGTFSIGDPKFLGRYSAKWAEQEQPTMSLYEVYIVNLTTLDTLSELVVADSEAKAHVKAFSAAGLGGTSVDDYHFICKRVGDVPSRDE